MSVGSSHLSSSTNVPIDFYKKYMRDSMSAASVRAAFDMGCPPNTHEYRVANVLCDGTATIACDRCGQKGFLQALPGGRTAAQFRYLRTLANTQAYAENPKLGLETWNRVERQLREDIETLQSCLDELKTIRLIHLHRMRIEEAVQ